MGEEDDYICLLGLKGEDKQQVEKVGRVLDKYSQEISEEFFDYLLGFEETTDFLPDEETLEKFKSLHRQYFKELTQGRYGKKYFEKRRRVGRRHEEIGLPPRLFMGAYSKYLQIVLPRICREFGSSSCRAVEPINSLLKAVFLDMILATEGLMGAREEKEREAKGEWRKTFDSINDGISIHRIDGTIETANQAMGNIVGVEPEKIEGGKCYNLFHQKEGHIENCPMLASAESKEPELIEHYEPTLEKWLSISTSPIFDSQGEVKKVVHVARDITERREAEEKLRKYSRELEEKIKKLESMGVSRFEDLIKGRNSYLLKEKRYHKSIAVFSNLVRFGYRGLCLTTQHPEILRETYEFNAPTEFVWLSTSGEGVINPNDLTAIHSKINQFSKGEEDTVILFLGLEYILTMGGFERSVRFIGTLADTISVNDSRLILSVDPGALEKKELGILEKSLTVVRDEDLISLGLK